MLILNEHNKPILIETLYDPIVSDCMWTLDLNIMDYNLTQIKMLEETVCPTITVEINGFQFNIPAHWYMLIYDESTTQLDAVSISDLTSNSFSVLISGPDMNNPESAKVRVVDYQVTGKNIYPAFNRHLMLCHPISEGKWINISFSDSYNRFLRNKYVSDLMY